MEKERKICCVFGHRKLTDISNLEIRLQETMERLILYRNVDTFLLGSKSDFDLLCRTILIKLKDKYEHIKRIYVRAEYPDINEDYKKYLLEYYDETYYPEKLRNAGKAVYVERNYEMIDKSHICVVYYKENYMLPDAKKSKKDNLPRQAKSGTRIAYQYAMEKGKEIINLA